jgi:hypothetical protein
MSAQKYLSYFGVYVRMPDPGGTANYTGSFTDRDYGHAWWCLSCDAPVDVIAQQLSAANLNPNAKNRLNVQEGYGPFGNPVWNMTYTDKIAAGRVYSSNDSNTNRIYQIGFDQLTAGLNWAQNLCDNLGTWDAKYNNCAEKVEALGATVGVPLPATRYPEYLGNHLPTAN